MTDLRVLVVNNYYPPFEVGGYEQLCRDVVVRLRARGHKVRVLTSDFGAGGEERSEEDDVHRLLKLHTRQGARSGILFQTAWLRPRAAALGCRVLHAQALDFSPDVVFIWNLQGLPRALAAEAEGIRGAGVAYWLAGYSPAEPDEYWQFWLKRGRSRRAEVLKALLRGPATALLQKQGPRSGPAMHHCAVVSEYERQRGVWEGTLPAHTRVIYNGVETELFRRAVPVCSDGRLRLLQAGRVSADKGVHLAIDALAELARCQPAAQPQLLVAGSGPPGYLADLRAAVQRTGLGDSVSFLGRIPREQMPDLLAQCHVLLLPTPHQEPFARVVLEAMAAGLTVVAADTGGTAEIVEHEVTGLLCAPDDSAALAAQIARLIRDPGFRIQLAEVGQRRVLADFDLERMVDEVEVLLAEASADRNALS